MIGGWLEKLGWVTQKPKSFIRKVDGDTKKINIGHSFIITYYGLEALRKARGKTSYPTIPKNICWEMLCTKGASKDKAYIRTRRAYIIKILSKSNRYLTVAEIQKKLSDLGIKESEKVVEDDIKGLVNIGLNIEIAKLGYRFRDVINDFFVPIIKGQALAKGEIDSIKDKLREELNLIPHKYLSLIDLAYNGRSSSLVFEVQTVELLINEYGFKGMHMGGSRKPDGIVYTINYGIILDTKSYSKGFSLPINEADKMIRYINENKKRDESLNNNKWWEHFPQALSKFHYLFVSSRFKGGFTEQLKRIYRSTNVSGGVINVVNLLLLGEDIKQKKVSLQTISDKMFNNDEIIV